MTAPNEIVLLVSAPFVLMFVLLALFVRRDGAIHWVFAISSAWLAGVADQFGAAAQPLAVALGSLATMLFATGVRAHAGRANSALIALAAIALPIVLGILTAIGGTGAGYGSVAFLDTLTLAAAVVWAWPRALLRGMRTAWLLPSGLLLFIPMNLYGQLSRSLGAGPEWTTVVVAVGLTLLAGILSLTLTARLARDEAMLRQGLEARLVEREGELEESLVRARSAERLASVGTLAAGIAHQINNPIGAILAASQFELSDAGDEKGQEGSVRSTLATIEREALRCARIVRSVLLFARTDPGRVGDHDLNAIVESACSATLEYAQRRGASIEIQPGASPLLVRGNEVELEQVAVNLIRNAIESRASDVRVEVRIEASPARATLFVEDNGHGLSDESRQRLFEPFYTTKLREGGSGLGLSVVHGIVTTHGGEIDVVSTAAIGTCFRVSLPRSERDAATRSARA